MVSKEVRDRLDHLPHAILRLAARRLDPDQRATIYEEVWLPDLAYYLRRDGPRPVTRLITGTGFAIGILAKARRIERNLSPAAQGQPTATGTDDPDFILVPVLGSIGTLEARYSAVCSDAHLLTYCNRGRF